MVQKGKKVWGWCRGSIERMMVDKLDHPTIKLASAVSPYVAAVITRAVLCPLSIVAPGLYLHFLVIMVQCGGYTFFVIGT